jgi:hypothetical protein
MSLRSSRADQTMLRRYGRVLTNQQIAEAVRRTPTYATTSEWVIGTADVLWHADLGSQTRKLDGANPRHDRY